MTLRHDRDDDQPDRNVPMNREERRKNRWRPEDDLSSKQFGQERLRDTRSRATFVRRIGPK